MERLILYSLLLILGLVVVYLALRRMISRSLDPKAVLESIREEVDRIIVQLNSTTERNISLLEDRVRVLSETLERADRKIAVLRREIEKHEVAGRVYSELASSAGRGRERSERSEQGGQRERRAEGAQVDVRTSVVQLHGRGLEPAAIAKKLGITLAEIEFILSLANRS